MTDDERDEEQDDDDFAAEIEAVAEALDADILIYSGSLMTPQEDEVNDLCDCRARRPNVLLMLATYGGDAHAAYRIARCLQRKYTEFYALIAGQCKSAGTLLVLGADELILHDSAELGPLDVQMRKSDELEERSSGLTPNQAMLSLDAQTTLAFQRLFLKLKVDMLLTTRTAAEIASSLVTGLYGGIYAQLDPMKLGEMQRALSVAHAYGARLQRSAEPHALASLVSAYPDHGFVIDREEAKTLFKRVREPSEAEEKLILKLFDILREPSQKPVIKFLNGASDDDQEPNPKSGGSGDGDDQGDRAGSDAPSSASPPNSRTDSTGDSSAPDAGSAK